MREAGIARAASEPGRSWTWVRRRDLGLWRGPPKRPTMLGSHMRELLSWVLSRKGSLVAHHVLCAQN